MTDLEAALQDCEERYNDLFDGSLGFFCMHDVEGRILSANLTACGALGYRRSELEGRLLAEFIEQPEGTEFASYLARIQALAFDTGLMAVRSRSGERRIWEYRNVLRRPEGKAPFVIGHAIDVTERVKHAKERREESLRDALTGCFNRRYLETRAADTNFGPDWGCIVVQIAAMDAVNAVHGPSAFDDLLVQTAHFLNTIVRATDAVVRVRDDMFVLLLNGAREAETQVVAERLRARAHGIPHPFTMGTSCRQEREGFAVTMTRAERGMVRVDQGTRRPHRRQEDASGT